MKYLLSLLITFLSVTGFNLHAQNALNLSIEHYLQEAPLTFGQSALTQDGQTFNVSRLQYYLSEISVEDHQGNVTAFDSLWVLVDASATTDIDLGMGNMDSIRSVTFHVGVDSAHNHLDPSGWPSSHPLAHKNPSMHWGWLSGYRFNAMEGASGDQLNQSYEIHGLGNENYFAVTVETNSSAENGVIDIQVYANCAEILRGLPISSGLISHGPIYEAQTSLENMRDYVFGATVPVSTVDTSGSNDTNSVGLTSIDQDAILIYPNPAEDLVFVKGLEPTTVYHATVYNAQGVLVLQTEISANDPTLQLNDLPTGLYQLVLQDDRSAGRTIHRSMVKR